VLQEPLDERARPGEVGDVAAANGVQPLNHIAVKPGSDQQDELLAAAYAHVVRFDDAVLQGIEHAAHVAGKAEMFGEHVLRSAG
jgi:hypothetical protein